MLKKIIAASALALAASGASAYDYGKYLCVYGCNYHPLSSTDVRHFVAAYVNPDVFRWKPNDKFSICDGTWCGRYTTWDFGIGWTFSGVYWDDRKDYKRVGELI